MQLEQMNLEQLQTEEKKLLSTHQQFQASALKLDLTRGKPSAEQLTLSEGMEGLLAGKMIHEDGTDLRNYGGADGIKEARQLGGDMLGLPAEEVMVGDHTSLTLMYLYLLHAFYHGVQGPDTAWAKEGQVKFICLVPGYDRHFTICEELGIEMIHVRLLEEGPDLDQIEALVQEDPKIKGIWCVPKYSNPTGHIYSSETVKRLAGLGRVAGTNFRVMWDNAYGVHDLDENPPELEKIMDHARAQGCEDSIIQVASTSKITFAGGGISFIGASSSNLNHFRKRLSVMTIGPNKLNQRRHMLFLQNLEGVKQLMKKHAKILGPKFKTVEKLLQEGLQGRGMGCWSTPRGGYFVSYDAPPGTATEIVRLAGEAGVKLTPAGATFPYRKDPEDANIRLAPTFPVLEEVDQAMKVFVNCVKLACVQQRLQNN
ncbi:MAG: aminotransferase class I/II-fold pyridoxal phosphate-dependent enzyme [SAR324 cluster bacterium]|jgi:aspartate/methionine/tyrosine aminotransferase|nr:aminotransferase class I/II-fold pyridoxal phosphate-dependent enzyme [SAR324 cluster bacterium]